MHSINVFSMLSWYALGLWLLDLFWEAGLAECPHAIGGLDQNRKVNRPHSFFRGTPWLLSNARITVPSTSSLHVTVLDIFHIFMDFLSHSYDWKLRYHECTELPDHWGWVWIFIASRLTWICLFAGSFKLPAFANLAVRNNLGACSICPYQPEMIRKPWKVGWIPQPFTGVWVTEYKEKLPDHRGWVWIFIASRLSWICLCRELSPCFLLLQCKFGSSQQSWSVLNCPYRPEKLCLGQLDGFFSHLRAFESLNLRLQKIFGGIQAIGLLARM